MGAVESKELAVQDKPQTALTVQERAVVALGGSERKAELTALSTKYADLTEIKNPAGRTQVHQAAMELADARIKTTKTGETSREDANQFQKAVIAAVKSFIEPVKTEEDRLLALRNAWDQAIDQEKARKAAEESNRISKVLARINEFRLIPAHFAMKSVAEIEAEAARLAELPVTIEDFFEYTGEGQQARDEAITKLEGLSTAAREREAESRRLAEERAAFAVEQAAAAERERVAAAERAEQERIAQAERDRVAAVQREEQEQAAALLREQQAEHARQVAAQQAEFDRQQAEIARQQAELAAAQEAQAQAARDEQARKDAEEQARLDAIAAEARRIEEAEAARAQAEKDAAAAERVRQVETAAEEERQARAAREAADTAMRNAASALYAALISQVSWAGEVSDEFLDGEPGLRDQFVADRKAAADALKLARGAA